MPPQPPQPQPQPTPPSQPNPQDEPEQPQFVYMARPVEPQQQAISEEIKQKHLESKRKFPQLNLSEGEYVISSVKRHPIGLVEIWSAVSVVIIALVALAAFLSGSASSDVLGSVNLSPMTMAIPLILISMLTLIFGFVATYIYNANRFYLTNESVIQHIQISLFNKREQTISLVNVEDASYSQKGIIPHLFDYGQLRLSTQGDETTYKFNYASNPERQIAILNDAVENFKNIRPMRH